MKINCLTDTTFKNQNQLIPPVNEYKYLGIEFNDSWNSKAFFKTKKTKAYKIYLRCYSLPNLKKKKIVISTRKFKPIQQVIDAATQQLAKYKESVTMNYASETIEHILLECSQWQALQTDIPAKYISFIEKKIRYAPPTIDSNVLCAKTTPTKTKFLNAIALLRNPMLNSIMLVSIPRSNYQQVHIL
ncbi:hypothetical protein BB561_000531 [Smittium simulii]|uniref:Uncharacterized protein n=1 Tax=Smittium simulii TaxID=133385 RepID=A0A2T9YYL3_9FUNG|nr:hypothetical protein BB561_000531 [Smittium simulii]